MSLRDQLLKSGLVDKKTARKTNQEMEAERKAARGERERRADVERRAEDAARQEREARQAALLDAKRARDRATELRDQQRRVSNLLRDYQVRVRGGNQPFWHRAADGLHVHKLLIHERLAWDLIGGVCAISWTGDPADPSYVLIADAVARRVAALEPGRVLFHNLERPDRNDPSEQLYGA